MNDAEVSAYLSSGRRKTIDNIAKHMKSEKYKLYDFGSSKDNTNRGSMKDITPSPSLKKHDREKMMKYLWKDMKAGNTTCLNKTLSSDIIHLSEIDPKGSLLHFATQSQMKSMVEILLKHKSPVCCNESSNGLAPIHIATKIGSMELISLMLEYKTSLHMVTLYEKRTLLHIAVKNRRGDILKFLLDKKVDPNAQDIYGTTPLNLAVCLGYGDLATTLLESGADVNLCDKEGWAPLHSAVTSNQPQIVKTLIHYKAIISSQTKYGKSPLHLACMKNNLELVSILVDTDAIADIKDSHGKIPANYTTNKSIVAILNDTYKPPEDEGEKHINMQIRSKSLIDLLDQDYLDDHYYSNADENQNLKSLSLQNLFTVGGKQRKVSLASLVKRIVNIKNKNEHEPFQRCNSITSTVCEGHTEIGNLETISENSEEDKSSVSKDSALEEVDYEHSIKDDTSEHGHIGHLDNHTDKELDKNKTDVTEYLKLHNTRITKIAMSTSTPPESQESGDDNVIQDMVSSTFDHVDRCLRSISEVNEALETIKNNGNDENKHDQVEKLKDFMQKWMENTVTFKINFKNKFGNT